MPLQIHKPKIASEVNSEHRLRLPALRDPIPKDVQELFTVSALDGMPRDCGNMRVEILTRLLCAWILETLLQGPRYSAWFHGQLVLTPS